MALSMFSSVLPLSLLLSHCVCVCRDVQGLLLYPMTPTRNMLACFQLFCKKKPNMNFPAPHLHSICPLHHSNTYSCYVKSRTHQQDSQKLMYYAPPQEETSLYQRQTGIHESKVEIQINLPDSPETGNRFYCHIPLNLQNPVV